MPSLLCPIGLAGIRSSLGSSAVVGSTDEGGTSIVVDLGSLASAWGTWALAWAVMGTSSALAVAWASNLSGPSAVLACPSCQSYSGGEDR